LAALLGQVFETETWDAPGTERELFCDETVRATLQLGFEPVVRSDGEREVWEAVHAACFIE